MPDPDLEHALNTELLNAELPDPRFADTRYLRWLYEANPHGSGIFESADEDGRRMAHYAVIPQAYRDASGPAKFVFSLNAVTRHGAQRKGYFTTLGEAIYERARRWGALGVIGVSNENSTPPVVKNLGFRLLGPLPVRVVAPGFGGREAFEHFPVDRALLESDGFEALVADLDQAPARSWTNCWTSENLRWRLASPNSSPYVLHAGPELVVVSTRSRTRGLRVAVLLKLLPRGDRTGPISARGAVAAVCRFHRAPIAVYAGFNHHVVVRGLRPPRRIQPAPLNLIYRGLSRRAPNETFVLDTFEFLDFDAY